MKIITTSLAIVIIAALSTTTFACPKGTSITGGTGPNHKGGKCVATATAATSNNKTSKENPSGVKTAQPTKEATATNKTSQATKEAKPATSAAPSPTTAPQSKAKTNP